MGISTFTSSEDVKYVHTAGGANHHHDASAQDGVDVPVLIIGGGPTGLLLAYLLSKLKIKALIVERYPQRLGAPKAHALSPRSLEICRQFGLDVRRIRQLGTPRNDARWVNFLTSLSGEVVGRLPYERMDPGVLGVTPEMIHNIPQPTFEQFLADHLAEDSDVDIRKGLSFVELEQDVERVTVTVEERLTGHRFHLNSRYLVACDGARSKVRECLQIESEGEDSYETMMTIHFNANTRPIVQQRVGMLHWIMDPVASGFIIAYDLSGNQVLISNFDPNKHPVETWNESLCRQVVNSALGTDVDYDILSYRPWLLSRKVAKQYRQGNVFLAGDAAHSFPPTGGLGLNSGLADVHNLAWKMAAVLEDRAKDALLDSYCADRQQVAEVNSQQSVKNGKKIFGLLKTLGAGTSQSLEDARENLFRTIRDPTKQAEIERGIEGQREHFDNLRLHIGYVYGDKAIPLHASTYVPEFVPGARLPHCWIKPLKAFPLNTVVPVDVSYVEEFSFRDIANKLYSTLDLCDMRSFTLITGPASKIDSTRHQLRYVRVMELGVDFELVTADNDDGPRHWAVQAGLISGGSLLIRPDQHILAVFNQWANAEDVAQAVRIYLDTGMVPASSNPSLWPKSKALEKHFIG